MFIFKQGPLVGHFAYRIVCTFFTAKGIIILQHQRAKVGQFDLDIRMQMSEIEPSAAYVLARATK